MLRISNHSNIYSRIWRSHSTGGRSEYQRFASDIRPTGAAEQAVTKVIR